jgi:hypothetical protein
MLWWYSWNSLIWMRCFTIQIFIIFSHLMYHISANSCNLRRFEVVLFWNYKLIAKKLLEINFENANSFLVPLQRRVEGKRVRPDIRNSEYVTWILNKVTKESDWRRKNSYYVYRTHYSLHLVDSNCFHLRLQTIQKLFCLLQTEA